MKWFDDIKDMKWFSENSGLLKRVTVVVALVAAVVALSWKFDGQIESKVSASEIRIDGKIASCVEKTEIKLASMVDRVQSNTKAQGIGIRADLVRFKLQTVVEKLNKYPNNQVLIEEKRSLQDRLEELTDKIDEILAVPIE